MSDASTHLAEHIAGLVARFLDGRPLPTSAQPTVPVEYMTAAEAAGFLRTTEKTLEHWRARSEGPRWIRMAGKRVRYALADLRAFMESEAGS